MSKCFGSDKVLIVNEKYHIHCLMCTREDDCLKEQIKQQRARHKDIGAWISHKDA